MLVYQEYYMYIQVRTCDTKRDVMNNYKGG